MLGDIHNFNVCQEKVMKNKTTKVKVTTTCNIVELIILLSGVVCCACLSPVQYQSINKY